jgi:hypothetical protein
LRDQTEEGVMAVLTSGRRNTLADSVFGIPSKRKYPMEDRAHQINAKARATQQEKKGKLSHATAEHIRAKANRLLHKSS